MLTVTDSDATPTTETQPPTNDVSPCYQAAIDRRDSGVDVCTIYFALTGDTACEQWISAVGDAFVSREDAR